MATRALHGTYLAQKKIVTNRIQIIYELPHELGFYIFESYEVEDLGNRYEVQVVVEGRMYVLRKFPTRGDAKSWLSNALRALRLGSACLIIGETVKIVGFKDLT